MADAQDLPFDDEQFDAVITESVTTFPEDKQQAVNEYTRVTKAGGYIGLNESTWLKLPPPPDMVAWVSQEIDAQVSPLSPEGWIELLKNAGLQDLVVSTHSIDIHDESKGILQRYGCRGILRTLWRTLLLYRRNPDYRQFVKRVRKQGIIPENIHTYFGYGLYVGRK